MKKKVVIVIALALSVILALTLFAGCAKTTDSAFSQGMIAVQKDGLWGFADESGDIVIDCKYDRVSPFYGEYAAVQMGSRAFLIDADGNDTGIELGSASVTANEDRTLIAATEKYTELKGVLNTESGEWVIGAAYDEIEFTEGGLVLVAVGNASNSNYGLFNAAGAEICPVEYEDVEFGANAVIMVKQEQGEMTADVFAADGTLVNEKIEILDADKLSGGMITYYYNAAAEGVEPDYRQVIPGTEIEVSAETSEIVYATAYAYVVKETGEDGNVTYSVKKNDGSVIFEGLTSAYKDMYNDVIRIDKTAADAVTPSYTYIDMLTGVLLENVPYDSSVTVVGEETIPAINFMRLPDDSLYYTLDGKIYAMDSTSPVFTGAEDESQIVVRAEGVFEETSKTGVVKIYNGATAIFEIGVGQEMGDSTSDGAYFTVKNAEGYMALYKNDGTQLFGFDKKITDVSFAG